MATTEHLAHIAVFVRVVELGSFTAAADEMKLSKAVVSKYVGALEERFGARLLNRTTRRLTLTEAGEALYRKSALALADLQDAEEEVAQLAGKPRGHLRLTAPVYFGTRHLVPRLGIFHERYPEITLDLDLSDHLVDLVKERFDLGLRVSDPKASSLIGRKLAMVEQVLCATPDYLERCGTPESPDDLRAHNCLSYSLDRSPDTWRFLGPGRKWSAVPVKGWFRCNSGESLKRILLAGLGIHQFPRFFVGEELADGRLVQVMKDYRPPALALLAVFPSRRNLLPKVRVFVDFLVEQFGK